MSAKMAAILSRGGGGGDVLTVCCLRQRNKRISEMRAPLAARREPADDQNRAAKGAICF